jgi:hypothetical protein
MKQVGQRGALVIIKAHQIYAVFCRYNCCPEKPPISPKHPQLSTNNKQTNRSIQQITHKNRQETTKLKKQKNSRNI